MATISISKTISAEHLARAIPALKAHFGLPDSATNNQVLAEWDKMVTAELRGIVKDYEARLAAKSASEAVTEISLS